MVNSKKIKGRIAEKGLTYQKLAPRIGCTGYTLGQKIANAKPIKLDEAMLLAEALDIKAEEMEDFFFLKKLQNETNNEE